MAITIVINLYLELDQIKIGSQHIVMMESSLLQKIKRNVRLSTTKCFKNYRREIYPQNKERNNTVY